MTPQERSLIQSVFDRLARLAGSPKDPEADAMIQALMHQVPDAGYQMVQAVVVQEQSLNEAQARIADLERQLAAARTAQAPQAPAPSGGLFSSLNPWGRSRVPQSPPPAPPVYPQQAGYPQGYPQQAGYPQQPGYGQPSPWGGGAPSAGGSFLRTAAGAAVGVAGGVLLAEGISNMFGGHQAAAAAVVPGAEQLGAPTSYDTQVADQGSYDPAGDPGYDVGGGFDDDGSF